MIMIKNTIYAIFVSTTKVPTKSLLEISYSFYNLYFNRQRNRNYDYDHDIIIN